jgi:hypothetical protein
MDADRTCLDLHGTANHNASLPCAGCKLPCRVSPPCAVCLR